MTKPVDKTGPSLVCPDCLKTTYNPKDINSGYCRYCRSHTSPPLGQRSW